jgi:hypothetical protein
VAGIDTLVSLPEEQMEEKPKYCIQCDLLKVKLVKGGFLSEGETVLEYISNGIVVKTQTLPYLFTDTLNIKISCFIDGDEPPKRYTVDDLMQMMAEKKE